MDKYKKLGQFFTTNDYLRNIVYNLILNNPTYILEPSIGQGHLIDYVQKQKHNIIFHMYEIDENIQLLPSIDKNKVIYGDFLNKNIAIKYKTIIGNPPYVKKKSGNLYLEFIKKCYNLLNNSGELIFIVPSDFIKNTSSSSLINIMLDNGTFTHMIHPNNENLFIGASIDIIIFRYCKDKLLPKITKFNDNNKILINTNGIITFKEPIKYNISEYSKINEYFNIFVLLNIYCIYNIELGNLFILYQ